MNINSIWWEKYRPKTLDSLILSDESKKILKHYEQTKDIPHLLFVSGPGTGKTSTAKIIVNDVLKCDYLYINASDENGIDTIRHKIIGFSQTKSFDGNIKVVILDEADSLSSEGSRALRNVMEEYSDNTRFILTANYKHKIISPIISRCETINFEFSIKDVAKHCLNILNKEGVKIPVEQFQHLQDLIRFNFPDFRRIIGNLQKYSVSGTLDIKNSSIDNTFISSILDKIAKEEIYEIRKYVISNEIVFQSDYHNLLKCMLNYIYEVFPDSIKKKEAILIIGNHIETHFRVSDTEINAFVCMVALSKLLAQTNS
jgi:DNA polymerase III delta prime subunit